MNNGQVEESSGAAFDHGVKKRFLVGDLVEVRQVEKGLQGSWHAAVVVEMHIGKRTVEYEELLEDDGVNKLRETVPVGSASDGVQLMAALPLTGPLPLPLIRPLLRPRPPAPLSNIDPLTWTTGFLVECLSNDAWWEAVILENVAAQLTGTDSASILSKACVEVSYPELGDTTTEEVKNLRVGQEWNEETGHWNVRGWEHVHEVGRPKKRGRIPGRTIKRKQPAVKKIRNRKEQPQPVAEKIPAVINDLPPVMMNVGIDIVGVSEMDMPNHFVNSFSDQNLLGIEAVILPCTHDDGAHPLEMQKDFPDEQSSPLLTMPFLLPLKVSASHMDEASARKFLTDAKWKVSRNRKKYYGKVNWTFRSPKDSGVVKCFSTLTEALNFENARQSALVNICQQIIPTPTLQHEVEEGNPAEDNLSGSFESDSKQGLAGEAEELMMSLLQEEEKNEALERQSNQEDANPLNVEKAYVLGHQGDPKDGLGPPSNTKSEETPHTSVSPPIPSHCSPITKNHSDPDDENREVDIITAQKRLLLDPGQKVMWSSSSTSERSPHFKTKLVFGAISALMEKSDIHILELYTAGYAKEHVRLILQNGELFLKTNYNLDKTLENFSVNCTGALGSRVVLPKNVEYRSITAELKDQTLTVTIPKSPNLAKEQIEIEIL